MRCSSRDGIIGERPKAQIGIQAIRGGDVVGVHTIYFMGPGERIEVSHQAHSRETFAQGALRAAAWLSRQSRGSFTACRICFDDIDTRELLKGSPMGLPFCSAGY